MSNLKLIASKAFYCLGDIVSRTFLMRFTIGYQIYKWLMLKSVDLDDKFEVWKNVKPKRVTRSKRQKRKSL